MEWRTQRARKTKNLIRLGNAASDVYVIEQNFLLRKDLGESLVLLRTWL